MNRKIVFIAAGIAIAAASACITLAALKTKKIKPNFDAALNAHLDAITNRDLKAFKSHLTLGDTLFTVVQNGHAFKTPAETIAIHEQWFKDPNWRWRGKVVHKIVGEDMAMALVRYSYQPGQDTAPFETWLIYVFQLQEGSWRIVHDQNTALDFHAFARASGLEK